MMALSSSATAAVSRRSVGIAFATQYVELGLQFISVLILARLLSADEIGTFSVAAFLMSMLHVFRDFGVANYIISARDLTREKLRSAAGVSIILALAVGAALYGLSRPVADFYANPEIEYVLVVMSASFAISPFSSTLVGVLRRDAQLGKIFWMKTFGALCHITTAIGLAWYGQGALSLAWANFAGILAFTLAGAVIRPSGMVWIPKFHDIRAILSFGSISSLGNLANMAGTSAPDLIMGKVLNMAAVGYYSRATGLVQLFARLISGALTPLVLPYFSQVQREGKPLVRPYLMAVEHLTALAWPFFACLLVLCYPIVRALYGATWDASVPVARLLCVASSLSALTLFAPQAMVASGGLRSSTLCNLLVQPIRILAVLVSAPHGMVAVAGSIAAAEAVALMVNSFFLYRVLGVRSGQVLGACIRSILITAASVAGPVAVQIAWGDAPSSSWPPLLAGIASATTGWLVALWLTRHPLGEHVFPMIGLTMNSAATVSIFKLKQRLRSLAYRSGVLGGWHRLRNADTLTIAMFHRVLPRIDPRFAGADPEWTMTPESLEQCLLFFARHYNVVTPKQVFEAMRGATTLPARSLLITFDDGWADTAEFAQPLLDQHGMAGLVFVASDAIGSIRPFWEEQVFAFLATAPQGMAHLNGLLARKGLSTLSTALEEKPSETTIRQCIHQLSQLPREKVIDLVASLPCNGNTAAMIDQAQLAKLTRAPHAVGGHGKTHQPLVRIKELDEELASAQSALAGMLGRPIESMSFPHGAASPAILVACHSAGYRYLFSSEAYLNKLKSNSSHTSSAGRIHISERAILGTDRRVDPARLASILFLRPHAS